MSAQFLLGASGRLLLIGGKPLSSMVSASTAITLTPFSKVSANAQFNIQPDAASGNTTADVPFVFTYAGGAPSSVQGRVVDANGNAIPGADWTTLQNTTATGGTGLGYLPGVRVGVGYSRQIRAGALSASDVAAFNVGPNLNSWGQSNMAGTLDGNVAYDATVPGITPAVTEFNYFFQDGIGAYFGNSGFIPAGNSLPGGSTNPGSGSSASVSSGGIQSLVRIVGDTLNAKYARKVGVCLIPWAHNGQGIANFLPGGALNTIMTNTGSTPGNGVSTTGNIGFSSPPAVWAGDYQAVAWHQGESESQSLSRAQRLANLKSFCQMHISHVTKFGRTADKLTFLFAIMGSYGTSTQQTVPYVEVLRGAVFDLIDFAKQQTPAWDVRIGWNCIDFNTGLNTTDYLHLFGDMKTKSLRRLTQAFMNTVNPVGVPHGAAGPGFARNYASVGGVQVLTGLATRSGDVVTITATHDGGTQLAVPAPGSPITGWYANTLPDFTGTDLAVTSVSIVQPNQIQMTVAGAPTTFYIKHCGGKANTVQSFSPDVTNMIFDNFVYPTGANAGDQYTGLPLHPTPDAIKVG